MPQIDDAKIAAAVETDIADLVQLVNSAYRGDSSRKGWTTEADFLEGLRIDEEGIHDLINKQGSTILKYIENDNILACVHLQNEGDHLYLGMLTVSPTLQGKGIGKVLLKAAEQKANEDGCKEIVMTVITLRDELIRWYERQGYFRTGKILPFPSDPRFGIPKQPLEFEVLRKLLS